MLDDAAHAVDLGADHGARAFRAHHGERRFEAVSEIPERVTVARHALALADQQRIEIASDAGELARIAAAESLAAPLLDLMDFTLHAPHGREHPTQQRGERYEQQQHQRDEPASELAPEAPQLLLIGTETRRHAEGE